MTNETLEEKVKNTETSSKFNPWDFLVAAYSSSKSVKLFLTSIAAGYSYISGLAAATGLYLSIKTIGLGVKYIAKLLINPFKNYNLNKFIHKNVKNYNIRGPQKRPHFMGGTLSAFNYYVPIL